MFVKLFVLGTIFFCEIIEGLVFAAENLVAVSPMVDSGEFYLEIKRLNPAVKNPKELKLTTKNDICTSITSSTFFSDVYGLDPVDPNAKDVYAYVAENCSRIYRNHYKPEFSASNDTWPKFRNPYVPLKISVQQTVVQDFAFTCLARKRSFGQAPNSWWMPKSKIIVQYFVSREYELNWWTKAYSRKAKGRFVFVLNENKETVVFAVAETPAHISAFSVNGLDHLEEIEKVFQSRTTNHTICDWSATTKVRLCSVILSADEYRGKYRLSPQKTNVKPPCDKEEFIFPHKKYQVSSGEWAVKCETREVGFDVPQNYYIMQGVQRYEFLIGVQRGTKILCEHHALLSR